MRHDTQASPRTTADWNISTPAERGAFSTDEGVLGIVLQASREGRDLHRVVLEGVGDITIDAGRRRYVAKVDDWPSFCAAPISRLRTSRQSVRIPSADHGRDLAELLWTVAYYASAGRLPADANRHALVKLAHWPNFTRLPCTPDMYRLCALLARRPSSIHLAGKLVGVDEAQAFRFFSAAHASGAIEMVTRTQEISSAGSDADDAAAEAAPLSETSLTSMLKLLWHKMTR